MSVCGFSPPEKRPFLELKKVAPQLTPQNSRRCCRRFAYGFPDDVHQLGRRGHFLPKAPGFFAEDAAHVLIYESHPHIAPAARAFSYAGVVRPTLGGRVNGDDPHHTASRATASKNDAADAEAICEAVRRPTMRFVRAKSAEQQGRLMLHRARDLVMRQRTQVINALRAHLAELGITAAQGTAGLKELLKIIASDVDERLPVDAHASLVVLAAELQAMQTLIGSLEKRIMAQHRSNEASQRLETIPGIGFIGAAIAWYVTCTFTANTIATSRDVPLAMARRIEASDTAVRSFCWRRRAACNARSLRRFVVVTERSDRADERSALSPRCVSSRCGLLFVQQKGQRLRVFEAVCPSRLSRRSLSFNPSFWSRSRDCP
jgi:hypothetical protein